MIWSDFGFRSLQKLLEMYPSVLCSKILSSQIGSVFTWNLTLSTNRTLISLVFYFILLFNLYYSTSWNLRPPPITKFVDIFSLKEVDDFLYRSLYNVITMLHYKIKSNYCTLWILSSFFLVGAAYGLDDQETSSDSEEEMLHRLQQSASMTSGLRKTSSAYNRIPEFSKSSSASHPQSPGEFNRFIVFIKERTEDFSGMPFSPAPR